MLFNLLHTLTVLIAAIIGYQFDYPALTAFMAVVFFLGREITQAEYKWIERYGFGKRANMPWYGSLDPSVWDVHSFWWNLILPILVAIIVYISTN